MAKMVRKQIYLRPHQDKALKDMVRETGGSEAELIREAIEYRIATGAEPKRDLTAWETERRFIEALEQKPVAKIRSWCRKDLYER